MISHKLEHRLDPFLKTLVSHMDRWGLTPNGLTVIGAVVSTPAMAFFGLGINQWAGISLLLASLFDMLDGALARTQNKSTPFGGFLDSVLDRYVDLGILAAIAYRYGTSGEGFLLLITLFAMAGTALVPYTRARAELIVPKCSVGVAERPERIIILAAGAVFDFLPAALITLALLTHITALQRILYTKKHN